MREVYKKYGDESGPKWILDLDGPDGNVYFLWGILEQFWEMFDWEGDPVEESKTGGNYDESVRHKYPYEGYEAVLDYCLYHLSPCPAAIEFRMYGHEVQQISDYRYALENRK
jgi:hypothetical protein